MSYDIVSILGVWPLPRDGGRGGYSWLGLEVITQGIKAAFRAMQVVFINKRQISTPHCKYSVV